ncbi:nitrite reductase [Azovibrio restrictus]|uniref:nitrite reductase n=1 Tax=Azovibrio restrictus TaxID=146938 RepID=UPI0003FD7C44|nr:nitrite reductase [Azovibrio restrictus]
MKTPLLLIGALLAGTALAQTAPTAATAASLAGIDPAPLYRQHCAACHGADRLGGMGPALLPESLERLRKPEAVKTIRAGRAATQMPAFGTLLSPEQIAALADSLYQPVSPAPRWSEADIRLSRIQAADPAQLPDRPVFQADPMNLFVVVEAGDHHVSILDGDKLEPIHRFASRYALHGGPKFSPDGRFVYFASRDGWITQFDLWSLTTVAEVRAGLNTRNAAVSGDGRYVMVANTLPGNLVLFDSDLKLVKVIEARSLDGKQASRVSAVYDASPRRSFVAAMKDLPEIWEISYDEQAPPIHDGLVHDYRMGEAIAKPGYLNPRRTPLEAVLDDFFFDQGYTHVMGASREGRGQVVNLDIRRKVADLALPGMPHLGSGITFTWNGEPVMASTNLKEGEVTVISMKDWRVVKDIPTRGPGFFLRSHSQSPYAFVDSMMSKEGRNVLQLIDKQKLEVVKEFTAPPGQTLAHVEFTKDGRYALASLWEMDGALVIYDMQTLQEIKRLPMKKPVGKYNVWNKIQKDEGTSH